MIPAPPATAAPPGDRERTRGRWELAAAVLLIVVRIALRAGDDRWKGPLRDWVLWIAAYWIFTVLARRGRAWPALTTALVLLLAAIYLEGNAPITIETLRWNLWP